MARQRVLEVVEAALKALALSRLVHVADVRAILPAGFHRRRLVGQVPHGLVGELLACGDLLLSDGLRLGRCRVGLGVDLRRLGPLAFELRHLMLHALGDVRCRGWARRRGVGLLRRMVGGNGSGLARGFVCATTSATAARRPLPGVVPRLARVERVLLELRLSARGEHRCTTVIRPWRKLWRWRLWWWLGRVLRFVDRALELGVEDRAPRVEVDRGFRAESLGPEARERHLLGEDRAHLHVVLVGLRLRQAQVGLLLVGEVLERLELDLPALHLLPARRALLAQHQQANEPFELRLQPLDLHGCDRGVPQLQITLAGRVHARR